MTFGKQIKIMKILIKTYKCVCGYHQDFEPKDSFLCPSCKIHYLTIEKDEHKKAKVEIITIAEIDSNIKKMEKKHSKKELIKLKDEMESKRKEKIKAIKLLE